MFCEKCGAEISKNAKFCTNCGIKVNQTANQETGIPDIHMAKPNYKKRKWGDGIIDAIDSKISGRKMETIRISMEDMLELLKTQFIIPASTDAEYKEIQKAVNGKIMGGISSLVSKDGRYEIAVSIAMQLAGRIDIFHPGDSNWIRVRDTEAGKVYQYSSFTWRKFKKAVKDIISSEQKKS